MTAHLPRLDRRHLIRSASLAALLVLGAALTPADALGSVEPGLATALRKRHPLVTEIVPSVVLSVVPLWTVTDGGVAKPEATPEFVGSVKGVEVSPRQSR